MQHKEYSAGAVKFSFWFHEFRRMVSLLQSGKTLAEIKTLAERDNIFAAASPRRSRQIFNTVSSRVCALTIRYYDIFNDSTLETQKLIALISIMVTDALFFDFMNEVYREKLIVGDTVMGDADLRVFFMDKQRQSDRVAGWKDETVTRLRECYKTYLAEAGLMERGKGDRKLYRPYIDSRLAALLSEADFRPVLNVLAGTR